jgi:hypothetical protein
MGLDLMREAKNRIEKINPNAVEGSEILVSEFTKTVSRNFEQGPALVHVETVQS